jgi:hypothetical protein
MRILFYGRGKAEASAPIISIVFLWDIYFCLTENPTQRNGKFFIGGKSILG